MLIGRAAYAEAIKASLQPDDTRRSVGGETRCGEVDETAFKVTLKALSAARDVDPAEAIQALDDDECDLLMTCVTYFYSVARQYLLLNVNLASRTYYS